VKCIGHAGASALAPANTLASFALAARLGADVVEFDVRLARGRLVLAHSVLDVRRRCLGLDEALGWLRREAGEGVGLLADLKNPGTERPLVDALRRHGLLERTVVASQCPPILARVRDAEPRVRTAISVAGVLSRRRQRWGAWRDEVLAALRAGRYRALMVHHRLADAALVERVHEAGAEVHAWTVRGPQDARALAGLDLDGIVTTDPRLVAAA
jgi:glycerophosphoryl diester phosphodiesterase